MKNVDGLTIKKLEFRYIKRARQIDRKDSTKKPVYLRERGWRLNQGNLRRLREPPPNHKQARFSSLFLRLNSQRKATTNYHHFGDKLIPMEKENLLNGKF